MANRNDMGLDDEGFIAGDAMASADLGQFFDDGQGAAYLQIAAGDGEAHQNADGKAEFGHVERDIVARDDASFFKPVNALGNCGRGEANLPANLRKRLTGILLQGFEDSPCNIIQFESIGDGPVGHVPAILKQ
jgi:hypothetical protein